MKRPELYSRAGIEFFEMRFREAHYGPIIHPDQQRAWEAIIKDSSSWDRSRQEPVLVIGPNGWEYWIYKGFVYGFDEDLSEADAKLLIIDAFDKERRHFERLRARYEGIQDGNRRQPLPESVRIFVWQRDEGRCTKCGSRENLEYDHIIPVSEGGSNTARNIELLCEQCNRSKSNKIQ